MEKSKRKILKSKITVFVFCLVILGVFGITFKIASISLNKKNVIEENANEQVNDKETQIIAESRIDTFEDLIGPYKFNITGCGNINVNYDFTNTPRYHSKLSLLKGYEWLAEYEKDRYSMDDKLISGNSTMAKLNMSNSNDKIYKAYLAVELNKPSGTMLDKFSITLIGPKRNVLETYYDKVYMSDGSTGIIDVTDFVKSEGYGEYYCCNIPYFPDNIGYDQFAAWKLIVIEENEENPFRNLVLYLGHNSLTSRASNTVNALGNGIKTPKTGTVTGQLLIGGTGADINKYTQKNSLKYSYDGTEAHEKEITYKGGIRTVKNPFTFVISKNLVPIETVTNYGKDKYVNDGYISNSPSSGYIKTVGTDMELFEVDGSTSKHNVTFANDVGKVSLKIKLGEVSFRVNVLGISVDVEIPIYEMKLQTNGKGDNITIKGSSKNTYELIENTGLHQTKAIVDVDEGIEITNVEVTFTSSDGEKAIYNLSENPDLIKINPETNEVEINWGKGESFVTIKDDNIDFVVSGIVRAPKDKYENSVHTSGYLYTRGSETKNYIEKIASEKSEIEYKRVEVENVWEDNNNEYGKRPESVIVQIYEKDEIVKEIEINEENNWRYEFLVPKYDESGNEIEYRVDTKEDENKFYEKEVDGNIIKNKFKIPDDVKSITGTKVWNDKENKYGVRPDKIKVKLYQDEKEIEEKEIYESDNWNYEFANLPVYREDATLYEYKVKEENIEKYVTSYSGNSIINEVNLKDIDGKVIWNDNDNVAGKRPDSVIIQIYNKEVLVEEIEVNEESNWEYKTIVPKYDETGKEIEYRIEEKDIGSKFYEKEEIENIIINKFKVPEETVIIEVEKKWEDNENEKGKRPEESIVQIKDGEKVVIEIKLNEENKWKDKVELPKYDIYGDEIEYKIDEVETPKGYKKVIENGVIVNKYVGEGIIINLPNTSDINITIYVIIGIVAIITLIVVILLMKKNKK